MLEYVLMVIIFSGSGAAGSATSFSQEFSTKATCVSAARSLEARLPAKTVVSCEKK